MPTDPYAAALEATNRGLQREVARLRAELDDQRGMTRGYRRLFIEALRRTAGCPVCNPDASEKPPGAATLGRPS